MKTIREYLSMLPAGIAERFIQCATKYYHQDNSTIYHLYGVRRESIIDRELSVPAGMEATLSRLVLRAIDHGIQYDRVPRQALEPYTIGSVRFDIDKGVIKPNEHADTNELI